MASNNNKKKQRFGIKVSERTKKEFNKVKIDLMLLTNEHFVTYLLSMYEKVKQTYSMQTVYKTLPGDDNPVCTCQLLDGKVSSTGTDLCQEKEQNLHNYILEGSHVSNSAIYNISIIQRSSNNSTQLAYEDGIKPVGEPASTFSEDRNIRQTNKSDNIYRDNVTKSDYVFQIGKKAKPSNDFVSVPVPESHIKILPRNGSGQNNDCLFIIKNDELSYSVQLENPDATSENSVGCTEIICKNNTSERNGTIDKHSNDSIRVYESPMEVETDNICKSESCQNNYSIISNGELSYCVQLETPDATSESSLNKIIYETNESESETIDEPSNDNISIYESQMEIGELSNCVQLENPDATSESSVDEVIFETNESESGTIDKPSNVNISTCIYESQMEIGELSNCVLLENPDATSGSSVDEIIFETNEAESGTIDKPSNDMISMPESQLQVETGNISCQTNDFTISNDELSYCVQLENPDTASESSVNEICKPIESDIISIAEPEIKVETGDIICRNENCQNNDLVISNDELLIPYCVQSASPCPTSESLVKRIGNDSNQDEYGTLVKDDEKPSKNIDFVVFKKRPSMQFPVKSDTGNTIETNRPQVQPTKRRRTISTEHKIETKTDSNKPSKISKTEQEIKNNIFKSNELCGCGCGTKKNEISFHKITFTAKSKNTLKGDNRLGIKNPCRDSDAVIMNRGVLNEETLQVSHRLAGYEYSTEVEPGVEQSEISLYKPSNDIISLPESQLEVETDNGSCQNNDFTFSNHELSLTKPGKSKPIIISTNCPGNIQWKPKDGENISKDKSLVENFIRKLSEPYYKRFNDDLESNVASKTYHNRLKEDIESKVDTMCLKCGTMHTHLIYIEHTIVHAIRSKECEICDTRFNTEKEMFEHLIIHNDGSEGSHLFKSVSLKELFTFVWKQCYFCDRIFNNQCRLTEHLQSEHGVSIFNHFCVECGKAYENQFDRDKCALEHQFQRLNSHYKCSQCENSFDSVKDYKDHVQSSHKVIYHCSECKKDFFTFKELNECLYEHKVKLPDENPESNKSDPIFKCPDCPRYFRTVSGIKVHLNRCHKYPGKNQSKCDVCLTEYSDSNRDSENNRKAKECSNKHLFDDTGISPFPCFICLLSEGKERGFCTISKLGGHKKSVHSGLSYVCDSCGATLSTKSALFLHHRKHTNDDENKKKCDICKKVFNDMTSLKRHMLIHTGENPFICSFCSKQFNQKVNLMTHELIHTGLRPHNCQKCGKGFTTKQWRDKHSKSCMKKD